MKILFKQILCVSLTALTLQACGDSDLNNPYGSTVVPKQVSIKKIKNLNGKSVVYFDRPDDIHFKYVKVEYETDSEIRTTNASVFTDSVTLEGFGKEGLYRVKLYSVSAGEAYSIPVETTVSPLKPPFIIAFENLDIFPTFGGIRVITNNATKELLTFYAYQKDENGEWNEAGALYTTAPIISHAIRGIEAKEGEFGVIIKDRWGHTSEMLTTKLTPWYEEECDKKRFNYLKIDQYEHHTQSITTLWDGITNDWSKNFMVKGTYGSIPYCITIDLGRKYKLSRAVLHGRQNASLSQVGVFTGLFPKTIEYWGRNDDNTTGFDETDNSWKRIMPLTTLYRADGTTTLEEDPKNLTTADKELVVSGHEVLMDESAEAVRYVCFRCVTNYASNTSGRFCLSEMTFYGTPVD